MSVLLGFHPCLRLDAPARESGFVFRDSVSPALPFCCTDRILGSGAACNKAKATEYQYRGSGAHRARRAVFGMAAVMSSFGSKYAPAGSDPACPGARGCM